MHSIKLRKFASILVITGMLFFVFSAPISYAVDKQNIIQQIVNQAHASFKDLREGKNANYIPELDRACPIFPFFKKALMRSGQILYNCAKFRTIAYAV